MNGPGFRKLVIRDSYCPVLESGRLPFLVDKYICVNQQPSERTFTQPLAAEGASS
jgi:hypothetical protein